MSRSEAQRKEERGSRRGCEIDVERVRETKIEGERETDREIERNREREIERKRDGTMSDVISFTQGLYSHSNVTVQMEFWRTSR